MFLAIVFIVLGLFLLLDVLGIFVVTNFWGLFWAIILLAIGIKMLRNRGVCPICTGHMWGGRIHERMHSGPCCDESSCECDESECEDGECECECECKEKQK